MQVLLTNDDGIAAEGLQTLRRALVGLADVELATIAPDGNRSAIARGITTRRPLVVERVDFEDGTHGFQTDGTPTDCVRLASLGLIDGFTPQLVVCRDQPRREPGRRHRLLGHGRRRLRGRRARSARDRGLPAGPRGRMVDFPPPRASSPTSSTSSRRSPSAAGPCSTSTSRPASRAASRSPRSASGSTTTRSSCSTGRTAAARTASTASSPAPRRSPGPTRTPLRRDASQ